MSGRRLIPVTIAWLLALLIIAVPLLYSWPAYAVKGLFNRSLTLGTSEVSAATSYNFQFDYTVSDVVGSIKFEFCSNNPIPFAACTVPSGFDISSATLAGQTGETGFVIDPGGVTANEMLLTRVPAAVSAPQTATYDFNGVVNPDTTGSYYVRLHTYNTNDGSGATVEEAGIAFTINDQFDVSAFVPPYLIFCAGITVAPDCSSSSGSQIDFGVLDPNSPNTATSQMAGGTNGVGGMSISIIGTTMTSGINSISALSTRGPSAPGTDQFGINLRDNSNPDIGAEPTGAGTTVPVGDYNVINEFKFSNGDVIANSPISTDFTRMTVSYLVNRDAGQPPGIYTATLTYVALATF